ncbi:MAG: hypothetical protein AAF152_06250 [Cyanobacteria bacterium P01_A01_bin.114]
MTQQNPFLGVWQRSYIRFDNGPCETRQTVLWIQAETLFADVRSSLGKTPLTPETYRQLGWQDAFSSYAGFSGTFSWHPIDDPGSEPEGEQKAHCQWHHDISIFPPGGADEGECHWLTPDSFIELGICLDHQGQTHTYEERWQRLSKARSKIFELQVDQQRGRCLLAAGWAIVVHDWRPAKADLLSDSSTFSAFSATAWQSKGALWIPRFSTQPLLGTRPFWTPAQILKSSDWQILQPPRGAPTTQRLLSYY